MSGKNSCNLNEEVQIIKIMNTNKNDGATKQRWRGDN